MEWHPSWYAPSLFRSSTFPVYVWASKRPERHFRGWSVHYKVLGPRHHGKPRVYDGSSAQRLQRQRCFIIDERYVFILSSPTHDNFREWRFSQKRLPDLADTIYTDTFATSDSSDESYDPSRDDEECEGDDTSADECEGDDTSADESCSQLVNGRIQPSDILNNGPSPSLVAYSDDDDDDGCSSSCYVAKPLTRLRRNGAIDTLEQYNGLPDSDSSEGEDDITATGARTESDTDSDTTDEDDVFKGYDAILPVLKEKVVQNNDVPTREQLVNTPPPNTMAKSVTYYSIIHTMYLISGWASHGESKLRLCL